MQRATVQRAVQAGAGMGHEGASEAGAAPAGPSSAAREQAFRFLAGDGKLTQSALVGLHQALKDPALVRKVIAARKRGVKFDTGGGKRDIKALVHAARLDGGGKEKPDTGGAPAPAPGAAAAGVPAPAGGETGGKGGDHEADAVENEPAPAQGNGVSDGNDVPGDATGPLQRKASAALTRDEHGPAEAHHAARGVSAGGATLPHYERIQQSFGPEHDLSGVKAHVGGAAEQAAREIGADAYTTGGHVAFAEAPDLRLAAHEAAHVVQQRNGVALDGGIGRAGDAYERSADAVADRVVAGQSAADLLPPPAASGGAGALQLRIRLAGADLDAGGATRAADGLVRGQLRDIVTARPANDPLIRETVRELHAASDLHDFVNTDALATNVRQRVLTSQYMRRSQGTTPHNMAFSYPDSANDGTVGVGPKVNDAAVAYWGPVQGGHAYFFDLSAAGRADAYQAILALFVEHAEPRRRTLIHCDYVVSVLRVRAYAESIGRAEFNRLVATNAVRLQLRYDMFVEMERAQGAGGRTPPLRTVTVASKADLIVGDHVVFWNHPSYDPLIAGTGGVWRLENAIVIDRRGGEFRFQGHGYFSPVNEAHLIRGMLHHYNIHVDDALALAARTRRGTPAQRTAAQAEMSGRFPKVLPRAAGGWEIRGDDLWGRPVVRELKRLTAAEAPGLINPSTGTIEARRPVEANL